MSSHNANEQPLFQLCCMLHSNNNFVTSNIYFSEILVVNPSRRSHAEVGMRGLTITCYTGLLECK